MTRSGCVVAVVLALAFGAGSAAPRPAAGQERAVSPVLTLDQERLLSESLLGAEIARELESRSEALASENRRIEAELIAEERALTEQRKAMSPEAFRPLAEAFDAKVQRIRAEQDAKERDLARLRDERRAWLIRRIGPELGKLAAEHGAVVVLDRRIVLLAADSIDITDEAIARINALVTSDALRPPAAEATAAEPGAAEGGAGGGGPDESGAGSGLGVPFSPGAPVQPSADEPAQPPRPVTPVAPATPVAPGASTGGAD